MGGESICTCQRRDRDAGVYQKACKQCSGLISLSDTCALMAIISFLIMYIVCILYNVLPWSIWVSSVLFFLTLTTFLAGRAMFFIIPIGYNCIEDNKVNADQGKKTMITCEYCLTEPFRKRYKKFFRDIGCRVLGDKIFKKKNA